MLISASRVVVVTETEVRLMRFHEFRAVYWSALRGKLEISIQSLASMNIRSGNVI